MNREEDEFGKNKLKKKKILHNQREFNYAAWTSGVQMPTRAFTMAFHILQDTKHTRLSLGYLWHGFFRFLDSGEVIKASAVLTDPPPPVIWLHF